MIFYEFIIFWGDCKENGIWLLKYEDADEIGDIIRDKLGDGLCFGDTI